MSSARASRMKERARRHEEGAARALDGFVRTPPALAEQIVSGHVAIGLLPRGGRVLEPSAGDGALVRMILDYDRDAHVTAIEPNGPRADALRALAAEHPGQVDVHERIFEDYAAAHPADRFDAVVMNPPFGNSTADRLWMSHIRQAWSMLHQGAQLAAVVPSSYAYRSDRVHREFREWATEQGARFEQLPRDAFAQSYTSASAGLLTVPSPLPARPDGLPAWLLAPATGAPVAVAGLPNLAASGVLATPVQEYDDRSDGSRPRVVRFAGACHGCGRLVWDHDDRHDAAVWEVCTVDAAEYGQSGPSVALCLDCYHQPAQKFPPALAAVAPYWTDAATDEPETAGPTVYPMDLDAGLGATVQGIDYRGQDFTITGRVMSTPVYAVRPAPDAATFPNYRAAVDTRTARAFPDERVAVELRTARGVDVTLYALPDAAVTVWDAPTDVVPAPAADPEAAPADTLELPADPYTSGWSQLVIPV